MMLCFTEREVEVNKLKKTIIQIKVSDIAMERDCLKEERDDLIK